MAELLSQVQTFFLVFIRVTAFMATAPFFGVRSVPFLAKAGLGFLVALLLYLAVPAGTATTGNPWLFALAAVNETLFGLALGYLANLIFVAITTAGELLDLHMGLSMATLFDPQNAFTTTLLGEFFTIFGLLLFLQVDGHHMLLLALSDSLQLVPLGGAGLSGNPVELAARLFAGTFLLALRIAAPVIVVLVISDIALGLVARTVPQLNVFILGFPLKVGLGLLILLIIFPLLATVFGNLFGQMERDLITVLRSWS
ncbi:MAG: flagellar biosynthesis protein FliR [Clostridia bacterium]|nr:flagellar biosynthesis protein FliR [Clostridia bacterium]